MQQSVVGRFYGLELGLQFAVEENHHEKNFTCIILQMVLIHTMRLTQTLPPNKEIQYWFPYYGKDLWLTSRTEHRVQVYTRKTWTRRFGLACQWLCVGRAGVIALALFQTLKEAMPSKLQLKESHTVGNYWSSKTGIPIWTNQTQ